MSGIQSIKTSGYHSATDIIVKPYYGKGSSIAMKVGMFWLNGRKISIDKKETLKSVSEKINKHTNYTGVKAKIIERKNGYGLHLVSSNKLVRIQDKDGVLKSLYENGHIGKFSSHFIRVTGGELLYNKSNLYKNSIWINMLKVVKSHNPSISPNILVVLNEIDDIVSVASGDEVDDIVSVASEPSVGIFNLLLSGVGTIASTIASVGGMLGFWQPVVPETVPVVPEIVDDRPVLESVSEKHQKFKKMKSYIERYTTNVQRKSLIKSLGIKGLGDDFSSLGLSSLPKLEELYNSPSFGNFVRMIKMKSYIEKYTTVTQRETLIKDLKITGLKKDFLNLELSSLPKIKKIYDSSNFAKLIPSS